MKAIFTTLVICCISVSAVESQTNWQWAESAGGAANEVALSNAGDDLDNSYITGYYYSDSITFGAYTLVNAGETDAFIVKYNSSGSVVWAKNFGSDQHEYGYSICVDGSHNVYVTGTYGSASINYAGSTINNSSSPGLDDIFIIKYDSDGNEIWAKSIGGPEEDIGSGITTDNAGYIYTTGSFRSDNMMIGATVLNIAGDRDIYVAAYNSDGVAQWAKSAGGNDYEDAVGICTTSDEVVITGTFMSSDLSFGAVDLSNISGQDAYVAAYDLSGNILWAQKAAGTDYENGFAVTSNGTDKIYFAGSFLSSDLIVGDTTLINADGQDIFLAAFDADGNFLWARTGIDNGSYVNQVYDVEYSGGYVIITGAYQGTSINFGDFVLSNAGNYDIFLVGYDVESGAEMWAESVSNDVSEIAFCLSGGTVTNTYVSGFYDGVSLDFGDYTTTNNGAVGSTDVFHSKLESDLIGISSSENNAGFLLFPNPSYSNGTIHLLANNISNAGGEFLLYDQAGKLIYRNSLELNTQDISLHAIAPGCYIAEIKSGEINYMQKLIVGN